MKNITMKIMTGTMIGVAGLLLAGCAGDDYAESEESAASIQESSGAEAKPMPQQAAETTSDGEVVIPLHEEKINVGKKTVDSGQVTIRKVVTTETVSEPVELRKEKIVIERTGAGASTESSSAESSSSKSNQASTQGAGNAFEEKTITIQLQEEQPVVEKTTVTTAQVVAKKNVEWDKQTVQREVRREEVQLDKSGNVAVGGNFEATETPGTELKEAAGAEPAKSEPPKPAPKPSDHKDAEYLNQLPPGEIEQDNQ